MLTKDAIQVYSHPYLQPVEKERHHVDWEISAAEKGGYEHFMAKGDHGAAQGHSTTPSLPGSRTGGWCWRGLDLDGDYLRRMDKIYIIACGSSYHVGMVGQVHPGEGPCASRWRWPWPLSSATATPW